MSEDKGKNTNKNSFKELERIQAEKYKENTDNVHNRVKGSMGTISLLSDIIELYFSRIVDVFINLSSGSSKNPKSQEEISEEESSEEE